MKLTLAETSQRPAETLRFDWIQKTGALLR